jgi:hypothetical protein
LKELLALKERHEKDILSISGVTGVGIRNARIIVYVESKEVAKEVPLSLEDIPVSVYVTGKIRPLKAVVHPLSLQALTAPRTAKWRPILGGISVGTPEVTAGTLSIVTRDNKILSNRHVFMGDVGTPVIQPGVYDGGSLEDRFGEIEKFIEVKPEDNYADCAIATPDSLDLVSHEILDVGLVYGWTEAYVGQTLYKSGRTTSLTKAPILDVNATIKVGYDFGDATFKDQIIFDNSPEWAAIAPGDSGSLAFSWDMGVPMAIGLCFAGSDKVGVANKISHVIDELGIDLGTYVPFQFPTGLELVGVAIPLSIPIGALIYSKYLEAIRWAY